MSQEVSKWLVSYNPLINGVYWGYNPLINGVYWGYNPLILTFDPNFLGHPSRHSAKQWPTLFFNHF